MLHKNALILIAVAALSGCGPKPGSTPEETLYSQMFTAVNTATTYDEVCNGSKFINEPNKNLYANISLLAGEMYGVLLRTNPKDKPADIAQRVKYQGQYAVDRAKEALAARGCESQDAGTFEASLKVFTGTAPEQLRARIAEEVARLPKQ